jgi:hypothetical protein
MSRINIVPWVVNGFDCTFVGNKILDAFFTEQWIQRGEPGGHGEPGRIISDAHRDRTRGRSSYPPCTVTASY